MRLPAAFQAFVEEMRQFHSDQLEFNKAMLTRFDGIDRRLDRMESESRTYRENTDRRLDRMESESRTYRENTDGRLDRIEGHLESTDHRLDRIEGHLENTDRRLDRIEGHTENTNRRLDRMEGDSSILKNFFTETKAKANAYLICENGDCELVRVLTQSDLGRMARALEGISRGDRLSFISADLIIEAADSRGDTVFLAVEISYTADRRDSDRAIRNAGYLADANQAKTIPVVAGVRYDREIQTLIDTGEITWFKLEDPR